MTLLVKEHIKISFNMLTKQKTCLSVSIAISLSSKIRLNLCSSKTASNLDDSHRFAC